MTYCYQLVDNSSLEATYAVCLIWVLTFGTKKEPYNVGT